MTGSGTVRMPLGAWRSSVSAWIQTRTPLSGGNFETSRIARASARESSTPRFFVKIAPRPPVTLTPVIESMLQATCRLSGSENPGRVPLRVSAAR